MPLPSLPTTQIVVLEEQHWAGESFCHLFCPKFSTCLAEEADISVSSPVLSR